MNKKLFPLLLISLTPTIMHFKIGKQLRTVDRRVLLTVFPEAFAIREKIQNLRFIPEREPKEIKKDLIEFDKRIDPSNDEVQTLVSQDKRLVPIFNYFHSLIQDQIKPVMGKASIDPATGELVKASGRREDSYKLMRETIVKKLLDNDENKLTTKDGKTYLEDFQKECDQVHYSIINEILYLEQEIFLMLQATAFEIDKQSYKKHQQVVFELFAQRYSQKYIKFKKMLDKLFREILGHIPRTSEFNLAWKTILEEKHPGEISATHFLKKHFPNRETAYQEFIEHQEKAYKRLIYQNMQKFAIVLKENESHVSPDNLHDMINTFKKQVYNYIRKPKKLIFITIKKNKFEEWKSTTNKSLKPIIKKMKNLNCTLSTPSAPCNKINNQFKKTLFKQEDTIIRLHKETIEAFTKAFNHIIHVKLKELVQLKKLSQEQLTTVIKNIKEQFQKLEAEEKEVKEKRKKELEIEETKWKKIYEQRKQLLEEEKQKKEEAKKLMEKKLKPPSHEKPKIPPPLVKETPKKIEESQKREEKMRAEKAKHAAVEEPLRKEEEQRLAEEARRRKEEERRRSREAEKEKRSLKLQLQKEKLQRDKVQAKKEKLKTELKQLQLKKLEKITQEERKKIEQIEKELRQLEEKLKPSKSLLELKKSLEEIMLKK